MFFIFFFIFLLFCLLCLFNRFFLLFLSILFFLYLFLIIIIIQFSLTKLYSNHDWSSMLLLFINQINNLYIISNIPYYNLDDLISSILILPCPIKSSVIKSLSYNLILISVYYPIVNSNTSFHTGCNPPSLWTDVSLFCYPIWTEQYGSCLLLTSRFLRSWAEIGLIIIDILFIK